MITLEEQLDKYLASLLVDEVFEAELVLLESHLFRVVAVPDGGHKSLNGLRRQLFSCSIFVSGYLPSVAIMTSIVANIFQTSRIVNAAT